jgi:hypothetical protein
MFLCGEVASGVSMTPVVRAGLRRIGLRLDVGLDVGAEENTCLVRISEFQFGIEMEGSSS